MAIAAGYCLTAFLVAAALGMLDRLSLSLYSQALALPSAAFAVIFLVGHSFYIMIFRRPDRLGRAILQDLTERVLTLERLVPALLVFLFLPPFISSFTFFKSLIPYVQPYVWDPALAQWDRWLHFGVDPWRLLQPVLGYPWLSKAVNFFYNLWFFVLYGVLFWQAFSLRDRQLRQQFLITFLLTWILVGTIAAMLLSSAGPVYFARVTGLADPFSELFAYLYAVNELYPLWALEVQEDLWRSYENRQFGLGSGISAMPSMHVAMAFLFFLTARRHGRVLGALFGGFCFVILLGSVHLGWHYAIDGYLSMVLVLALWLGVGRCMAPGRVTSIGAG